MNTLNINTLVMFLVSLTFTYVTVSIGSGTALAYDIGFLLGRSMISILIPFALVGIPLVFFRRGKKKFTKGAIIAWWILFVLLSLMALVGNLGLIH